MRHHGAPLGQRRLRAHAQEGQRGEEQDGEAHVDGGLDEHGRQAVRQQVEQEDAPLPLAQRAGGEDELLLALHEDLAAHEPRVLGPPGDDQRDGAVDHAAAHHGGEGQRPDDLGKREEELGHPHQPLVGPPARGADQEPREAPDRGGGGDEQDRGGQGRARAVDHPRPEVAPVLVGAEGMGEARGLEPGEEVDRVGIPAGERARDGHHGREDEQDGDRAGGERTAAKDTGQAHGCGRRPRRGGAAPRRLSARGTCPSSGTRCGRPRR